MKNYNNFKEEVIKELEGRGYDCNVFNATKNNVITDNLSICKPYNNMVKSIDLKEQYLYLTISDEIPTIEDIVNDIEKTLTNPEEISIPIPKSKEEVLASVVPDICCRYKNNAIIRECPTIEIEGTDLIIYFRWISILEDTRASFIISNKNCSKYDINIYSDALFKKAWENYGRIYSPVVNTFNFDEYNYNERNIEDLSIDDFNTKMIIITNNRGECGSVYLADKTVMDSIKSRIGNFYILPSSIHEFIIMPAHLWMDGVDIIVKEVNKTLKKTDILSDNVYYYDGKLSKAN